jgi:hypothetical protein
MSDAPIAAITAPIAKAVEISGISRSQMYRDLAAGKIKAVKSGRSILIVMDSLRAHLARLPTATFRAPAA